MDVPLPLESLLVDLGLWTRLANIFFAVGYRFQFLQTGQYGGVHSAVFGSPLVEGRTVHTVLVE